MKIPRLHPDTIEEVKQRVDAYEIISEKVVLRKRGRDYLGLCPFHEEKTPSFTVSPGKQMYYCFGCGAGGSAITFLKQINQSSFTEVVLDLARRYQIPVKTLEPEQRQALQRQLSLREQLYSILAVTASFYQHALHQPQGEIALDYLRSQRQLEEGTIGTWKLGYAPEGWETLYHYLIDDKRYPVELVVQAGLIKQRKTGRGYYDIFRNRLMIPIADSQGRIIAFGSRTLTDEQPKYLNSPETSLFDKSKTLFALDRAKSEIAKQDQAVVVEGYFDAIALHAAGITHAVASLGTAFTQDQIKQLLRYSESKQVVLNFDADGAGRKATQRAIEESESLVYSGQVQLRVLNLPDGKDADEYLRGDSDGVQNYHQLLQNAPLWLDWQINQLLQGQDLNQADCFQKVAQEMVKLLSRLEDSNKRTYYVHYCAQLLAQGDAQLIPLQTQNLLAQLKKPRLRQETARVVNQVIDRESNLLQQAEAWLLLIYIHCSEYRQEIVSGLEDRDLWFSFSHHRFLWQQILQLQASPGDKLHLYPPDKLVSQLQDLRLEFPEAMSQVTHLLQLDETRQETILRTSLVIQAAIASLELVKCERHKRRCLERWRNLELTQEEERYYSQEVCSVQKRIGELLELRQFKFNDITEIPLL